MMYELIKRIKYFSKIYNEDNGINFNDEIEHMFYDALEQISLSNNSEYIPLLFQFFNDELLEQTYYDYLWEILITIEYIKDNNYYLNLLSNIGLLLDHAIEWAITFHVRILNSPSDLLSYLNTIPKLNKNQLNALETIINKIKLNPNNQKFTHRCNLILNHIYFKDINHLVKNKRDQIASDIKIIRKAYKSDGLYNNEVKLSLRSLVVTLLSQIKSPL